MSTRRLRHLNRPATWLLVGFAGFFILVFGATALFATGFLGASCSFPRVLCRTSGLGWTLYALGVLSLVGGIVGYLVTRPDKRSPRSG